MDPEQTPIWTPPEKLDPNVQRMAWLMFVERWKAEAEHTGFGDADPVNWLTVHQHCLKVAKIVRDSEVEAGG